MGGGADRGPPQDELIEAARQEDVSDDGARRAARAPGALTRPWNPARAEVDEFINELDSNKDGGVSWEEYVEALFAQVRVAPRGRQRARR